MKLKSAFIISFIVVSINGYAQISFKTEYFGTSGYWLDKGEEPRERIGESKGSAIVYQGNINIPLSVKIDKNEKPVIWGIGLGGAYASLNNRKFTEDLVISDIMNLELGFYHIRPLSRKWSLMASIGAGIYSPSTAFSDIRAKHILGSVSAVFICRIRPNFELGGGIAVNSTFGYPMAFPALYLNWSLQGKFDFLISMTNGLELSAGLDINRYLKLALIADMNGQTALLEKDGKDVIFTHQYIVTGLRPEIRLGKTVSIPLTAGINAVRPAYFSDRTLKAMFKTGNDYYFQISPYVSAGITVNF